jgi:hypothetical protein
MAEAAINNGMPPNMRNAPKKHILQMSSASSQEYIFTLIDFLHKRITSQPFLELLRRSVTDAGTARWLYFPRAFNESHAAPAPDYGQIFRFFLKGTSAAGILASGRDAPPFDWQRQNSLRGTRRNSYRTNIGDIDCVLIVNPKISQYDYVIVRSLLMIALIEALQEFMSSPMAQYQGQIYDDHVVNEHIISAPLGANAIIDESYVCQKTIFLNSATPVREVPATCPFYYKLHNNLFVKGEKTGLSLLKVLARGVEKGELIDILIPSHEGPNILGNWEHSEWLVNYRVGPEITVPIMHPQYLILEFDYAMELNIREEKTARRQDAKKLMVDLLLEDDIAEELNASDE